MAEHAFAHHLCHQFREVESFNLVHQILLFGETGVDFLLKPEYHFHHFGAAVVVVAQLLVHLLLFELGGAHNVQQRRQALVVD